jgi:acyl carrier protein
MSPEQGMALFDSALDRAHRAGEPVLAPILLEVAALRARGADAPPILRGLVAPVRPRANAAGEAPAPAPTSWRSQLADLPPSAREQALAELIRGELAAVLGYPEPAAFPAEKRFTDLGFDSLSAVQLRNRLSVFTGIRLPATLVLDHPTLPELTTHVYAKLSEHLPQLPAEEPAYRLASLYRRICAANQPHAAGGLLVTASYAAPAFTAADSAAHAVAPIRMSSGARDPALVYFPTYMPTFWGPLTQLSERFQGDLDLFMMEHPGFGHRKAVPDNPATLAQTHAAAMTGLTGQAGVRPLVLVGYCTGGAVAHAVAAHLAAAGAPPAGLVLIDTHHANQNWSDDRLLALLAHAPIELGEQFDTLIEDATLVASGAYTRIFAGWRPEPIGVPTLLIRAEEPTAGLRSLPGGQDWRPRWPLPHDTVDVPGNHLTILYEHAPTTAAAIRTWVNALGWNVGGTW